VYINKSIMTTFVFLAVTLIASPVNAVEHMDIEELKNCKARHKSRLDYSKCLDSALLKLDRDIETWEKNVEFKLKELSNVSGRGDALLVFSKASRQFHSYRQSNCRWQYLAKLPDVDTAAKIVKECKIGMAKDRINKLMQMSRLEY